MHHPNALQLDTARILLVDDDVDTCSLMEQLLGAEDFVVVSESSADAALARLTAHDFDAVLTDIHLPGTDGIELCRQARLLRPEIPVIVVTGDASLEAAIAALRAGAYDFITKPISLALVLPALARAVQHHRLGVEVAELRRALAQSGRFGSIIGQSTAIRKVFDLVTRVAEADVAVLVTGESGTGKELVARAIHDHSARASGPFVAVNCAAVPANLIESELFGHVAGAFTDARGARLGLFAEASGGTLFLDEIGELPLAMQPKLLRALQERKVRPVGSDHEVAFDARLVTATNRDLEAEVELGRFREDLLYRIDVVRIDLPPLRMRGRDVLLLAQSFLQRFATPSGRAMDRIDPAAAQRLLDYEWPGNVRELENCIERAVAIGRSNCITVEDLPEKVREYQSPDALLIGEVAELITLEQLADRYVSRVLLATAGNKSRAATILGVDRRTLGRRLKPGAHDPGTPQGSEPQSPGD